MEIIHGTREHRPVFLSLWREFLKEQYDAGGPYLATDQNLLTFLALYDAYEQGILFGGCWFIKDDDRWLGVLLVGEDYPNGRGLDTRWGKVATIWGTYIIPEHRKEGLAYQLQQAGQPPITQMGFDTMVSSVSRSMPGAVENATRYPGIQDHGIIVVLNLHEN